MRTTRKAYNLSFCALHLYAYILVPCPATESAFIQFQRVLIFLQVKLQSLVRNVPVLAWGSIQNRVFSFFDNTKVQ